MRPHHQATFPSNIGSDKGEQWCAWSLIRHKISLTYAYSLGLSAWKLIDRFCAHNHMCRTIYPKSQLKSSLFRDHIHGRRPQYLSHIWIESHSRVLTPEHAHSRDGIDVSWNWEPGTSSTNSRGSIPHRVPWRVPYTENDSRLISLQYPSFRYV